MPISSSVPEHQRLYATLERQTGALAAALPTREELFGEWTPTPFASVVCSLVPPGLSPGFNFCCPQGNYHYHYQMITPAPTEFPFFLAHLSTAINVSWNHFPKKALTLKSFSQALCLEGLRLRQCDNQEHKSGKLETQ